MQVDNVLRLRVALIAAAAGIAFCAMSICSLLVNDPEHYIDALMIIPFSLALAGVVGIHSLQRKSGVRSELIGFRVLAITLATMVISQPTIVFDITELSWIAFPCAFLGFLAGTALFGYSTYRARVLPVWCALAIGLSQLLTMAAGLALSPISPISDYGDYSGAFVHGLVWLAIAYAVLSLAPSPAQAVERTAAATV